MLSCTSKRLSNLYLKCLPGVEKYLQNELISLGFCQNDITISHSSVSISNVTLKHAYFISYFSRFTKQVYLELASFISHNSSDLLNSCKSIDWSKYLNPSLSFMVNSNLSNGLDNFRSHNYTSLVVKDAIMDYFANRNKMKVDLKNPDLKFLLTINSAYESIIYVDLIGSKLNNRNYKNQVLIQDIDSTLANSLLYDFGFLDNSIIRLEDYLTFLDKDTTSKDSDNLSDRLSNLFIANYRNLSFIDTSCGIGTIPIECAMIKSGISCASFINRFSAEVSINQDKNLLYNITSYYNLIRKIIKYNSKNLIIGCEKNWEKIKIAVDSANNAGVLNDIKFHLGSPTDVFKYIDNINNKIINPIFVSKLPMTGIFLKEIRSGSAPPFKKYQENILNKMIHSVNKFDNSKLLLLIPNCYKKSDIEALINTKLEGGRSIFFNGIHWACYNYTKPD